MQTCPITSCSLGPSLRIAVPSAKQWNHTTVVKYAVEHFKRWSLAFVVVKEKLRLLFSHCGHQQLKKSKVVRLRTAHWNDIQKLSRCGDKRLRDNKPVPAMELNCSSLSIEVPSRSAAHHHRERVSYNEATQTLSEPWLILIQRLNNPPSFLSATSVASFSLTITPTQMKCWRKFIVPIYRRRAMDMEMVMGRRKISAWQICPLGPSLQSEKLRIFLWFEALTIPRRPNVNPIEQRKQPVLIKTDNIKRSAADAFWRTRPYVCGATLFTCHDGWGAFIWRGWNHNVGMQKIAARKQQTDYEALEVSAGMRWAFSLVVKVWIYHRLSGARR